MSKGDYLYTVDPASTSMFLRECREGARATVTSQLEEGVFLLHTSADFRPLFARHRFRIDGAVEFDGLERLPGFTLPGQGAFGFQLRANHRLSTGFKEIAEAWARSLELSPERIDVRAPQNVVSGYFYHSERTDSVRLYYGLSLVADNLSPWAGGFCRIPLSENALSRAEQKLLEALELEGKRIPRGGLALDLGAAPGGWTRVAAEMGFQVHAVDPADLHSSLRLHPRVTHHRTTAGEFIKQVRGPFDLLLCDMKMEAKLAVDLVLEYASVLSPNAFLVMTLKLPKKERALLAARQALRRIEKRFSVMVGRQLYFNRSEITIVARRASQDDAT